MKKILWISLCVLAAAALATGGWVWARAGSMWAGSVPIADKPTVYATDEPAPRLTLLGTAVPDALLADDPADTTPGTPGPSATAATPIYRQTPMSADTVNVLLVGIDARTEQETGRSDSMMLLSYNRKLHKVAMVSFLRDMWVPIEGHGWNRLNACYEYGGVGLTINTINRQFGLDIQNYIIIRFEQLQSVIDEMGGIDVALTRQEAAYYNRNNYGLALHAGIQTLNGDLTLQHVRNRKIGNVDFDRTRRQRDVVLAIFKKLKSVKDASKLTGIMQFAFQNVKTNMPPDLLFSLAAEGIGTDGLDFTQDQIPIDGTWQYAYENGNCVLSVDIQKNADYIAKALCWK